MSAELNIVVEATGDLRAALRQSDVCVTCTPARLVGSVESDLLAAARFVPKMEINSPGATRAVNGAKLPALRMPVGSI